MAALVLVVAGCGANGELPMGDEPAAPGPPVWVEPVCSPEAATGGLMGKETPKRGAVPADFVTVAVMRCRTGTSKVDGRGEWTTAITEKADTSADDLVAQVRKPSARRTDAPCPAIYISSPYFMLINAEGKAVLPEVPQDPCGQPAIEVRNALDALPYKLVAESPLGQSQSQLSIDTGCSDSWKDLLAIDGLSHKPGPATKVMRSSEPVLVCVYQSEGDVGKLVAGHKVPAEQLATLDKAGPAVPCEAKHSRYAVLSGGTDALVELDGCHRMIRPDQTLGQVDAATAAILAK